MEKYNERSNAKTTHIMLLCHACDGGGATNLTAYLPVTVLVAMAPKAEELVQKKRAFVPH